MKKLLSVFILLMYVTTVNTQAQGSSVIAKKARIENAGSGFGFTEGPAVAQDGRVFFTDQPNDRIYIWDEKDGISLYKEGVRRSNGMYFNKKGQLFSCADEKNQLIYFDKNKNIVNLYEGFDGKHLNGPNDLWISPQGGIYFSDPYYHRSWWSKDHSEIQDVRGVYFLSPNKKITRVIDDFISPNGLVGTPDGKTLYVSDIRAGKIWRYNIMIDGNLTGKTFFAPYGSDGMTIDNKGNVYLTSDMIYVYNSMGKLVEKIEIPQRPANVCFGGKKRNILFITARTGVYTLKMKVKGVN